MKLITVGRSNKNNIVVNDIKVSDEHAQIVVKCSIVDLNSANGTFVNDVRISGETPLKAGDRVRVGNTTLPWQDYIESSSQRKLAVAPSTPTPAPSCGAPQKNGANTIPPAKAKSNNRRLIALILVALVAVALGVVTYLFVFAEKSAPKQIQREEHSSVTEDIIQEKMNEMAGLKIFAGSILLNYEYIDSIIESDGKKESMENLINAYIEKPTDKKLDKLANYVIRAITREIPDKQLSDEDKKNIEHSAKLYLEIISIKAK